MHGLRDVVQELGFLARPRLGVEGADRRDVRDVHDKFARVDNNCWCSINLPSQVRIANDCIIVHFYHIFNWL